MEVYNQGPNYYQVMNVNRSSSALEIKKAYKKMSLETHPDKNKSPTAAEDFARLKDAYDVSPSQRPSYVHKG
jgi:DnaJ-class molecular chaperone